MDGPGPLHARPDPDLWFPVDDDPAGIAAAAAVCQVCPVRLMCLSWSLALRIDHGVWGGVGPVQRRAIARELAKGQAA